jgi:hypothetical protein
MKSMISFKKARLEAVHLQPTEDGAKAVMQLCVPLTEQLAEQLDLRYMLYAENGIIAPQFKSANLNLAIVNFEIAISTGGDKFEFRPEKARAFSVTREEDAEGSVSLELSFRVHLSSEAEIDSAYAIFKSVNKGTFALKLASLQGDLFAAAEDEPELDADGQEPPNGPVLATTAEMKRRRSASKEV